MNPSAPKCEHSDNWNICTVCRPTLKTPTPQEKSRCCEKCWKWDDSGGHCGESLKCRCHSPADTKVEDWEEELKRQCEIRKLPYADVKYLVDECLSSQRDTLVEGLEKLKQEKQNYERAYARAEKAAWNNALDAAIKLIKETR
jgi:hypothetical protein